MDSYVSVTLLTSFEYLSTGHAHSQGHAADDLLRPPPQGWPVVWLTPWPLQPGMMVQAVFSLQMIPSPLQGKRPWQLVTLAPILPGVIYL